MASLQSVPGLLLAVLVEWVQIRPGTTQDMMLPHAYHADVPDVLRCPNLTVPLNRTGSWGMMDNLLRRSARPMSWMSTPSIRMDPPQRSTSRNRTTPRDDFPAGSETIGESSRQTCQLWTPRTWSYLIQSGPQCRPSLWAGWCRRCCSGPRAGCPGTSSSTL